MFVSLADRPLEQLLVDPHWSNTCASITSSAQHQSEIIAQFLLKDLFVEKHLDSDTKNFFRSVLRDLLPRDDDKPSAAVLHTWDDTNVSQADQDGAVVLNSTCVRDSCFSGELHIKSVS